MLSSTQNPPMIASVRCLMLLFFSDFSTIELYGSTISSTVCSPASQTHGNVTTRQPVGGLANGNAAGFFGQYAGFRNAALSAGFG